MLRPYLCDKENFVDRNFSEGSLVLNLCLGKDFLGFILYQSKMQKAGMKMNHNDTPLGETNFHEPIYFYLETFLVLYIQ